MSANCSQCSYSIFRGRGKVPIGPALSLIQHKYTHYRSRLSPADLYMRECVSATKALPVFTAGAIPYSAMGPTKQQILMRSEDEERTSNWTKKWTNNADRNMSVNTPGNQQTGGNTRAKLGYSRTKQINRSGPLPNKNKTPAPTSNNMRCRCL